MKKDKRLQAEAYFQDAYEILESEKVPSLTSDGKFLKPLKKAAELGNAKASFMIGYLLCTGYKNIVDVDVKKGERILSKCFEPLKKLVDEDKDYQACKFLSEYYRMPLAGHVKDDEKVEKLLKMSDDYRAAKLNIDTSFGDEPSFIADKLSSEEDGEVFDQLIAAIKSLQTDRESDHKDQLDLISHSAKSGNMRAALFLGDCYYDGRFVKKDVDLSISYYELAESLGSLKAKFNLGKIYIDGNYSHRDMVQGLNRVFLAAKGGLKEALYYLGRVYYEGKIVDKDLVKAYVYFQASFSRGYLDAESYMRKIEKQKGDRAKILQLLKKETN